MLQDYVVTLDSGCLFSFWGLREYVDISVQRRSSFLRAIPPDQASEKNAFPLTTMVTTVIKTNSAHFKDLVVRHELACSGNPVGMWNSLNNICFWLLKMYSQIICIKSKWIWLCVNHLASFHSPTLIRSKANQNVKSSVSDFTLILKMKKWGQTLTRLILYTWKKSPTSKWDLFKKLFLLLFF